MYYKEEMTEIEALHKERAGVKTKVTVKKRKNESSPRKIAKKKVSKPKGFLSRIAFVGTSSREKHYGDE